MTYISNLRDTTFTYWTTGMKRTLYICNLKWGVNGYQGVDKSMLVYEEL